MIKKYLVLLFFLSVTQVFADHHEGETMHEKGYNTHFRLFHKQGNIQFIGNYLKWFRNGLHDYQEANLLTRYKINNNFRIGLGLQSAWGKRHNEDWVFEQGTWGWRDTAKRNENSANLQLIYRNLVPIQLTTVFEMRLNYFYNFFNDQHSFKLRPAFNFIISPKHIVFTQYEIYVLPEESMRIYEWWTYLGYLYRLTDNLRIGPSLSYAILAWNLHDDSYQAFNFLNVGLNLNYYF